jgi:SAM-dependent methyltransferase
MMESDLISCLCCPHDQSRLLFNGTENAAIEERAANLQCVVCGSGFPIEKGIPRFLTAEKNDLCPLQRSEMETRDSEYRAGLSGTVNSWYVPEFDALQEALGDCRGLSVIDAGCGAGKFSPAIRGADRFLGIDFSWEGLIRFQSPPCVSAGLVQADITQMPIRDRMFDVSLSCQVLSHLPTANLRSRYLAELSRILKPDGRLILTAMHYSFRYRRRNIPQEAEEDGSFYHRFEVAELRSLLSERFTIVSMHGYWIYLPKTYWLFVALGSWKGYWDRIWRSFPFSLTYGKYLLTVCSPKP